MDDIEKFCLNYKDTMRILNYIEEILKSPLVDLIPWLKLVSANKIFFFQRMFTKRADKNIYIASLEQSLINYPYKFDKSA